MGVLDEEFLTVAEVSALLKLNQQTVRNWIGSGYLKAFHVGRRVRIIRSDRDELLERSRIQPPRAVDVPVSPAVHEFWKGTIRPCLSHRAA